MNVIKREAYPVIFKVIADAEFTLSELTGQKVEIKLHTKGEWLTKGEARKIKIQTLVCDHFKVSWAQLSGPLRMRDIVNARKAYVHFAITFLHQTTVQTGKDLHRDHTTIMHLRDACENHISLNDPITEIIDHIKILLYENNY